MIYNDGGEKFDQQAWGLRPVSILVGGATG
jgi:hypothetical protein